MHVVRAQGADGDGIGEGLHAGLQAEGDLGVAHGVPGGRRAVTGWPRSALAPAPTLARSSPLAIHGAQRDAPEARV